MGSDTFTPRVPTPENSKVASFYTKLNERANATKPKKRMSRNRWFLGLLGNQCVNVLSTLLSVFGNQTVAFVNIHRSVMIWRNWRRSRFDYLITVKTDLNISKQQG